MSDVNESLDARRIARDQESRIAASTLIGLNAAKPFVELFKLFFPVGTGRYGNRPVGVQVIDVVEREKGV